MSNYFKSKDTTIFHSTGNCFQKKTKQLPLMNDLFLSGSTLGKFRKSVFLKTTHKDKLSLASH